MILPILLALMGALGGMLLYLGITANTWEYWAIILIVLGIFSCGAASE